MSSSTTLSSAMHTEASDQTTQAILEAGEIATIYWIDNTTPKELCRRIRSALVDAAFLPDELRQLWDMLRRSDGSFDFRQDFLECEASVVYSRITRKIHSRTLQRSELVRWLLIVSKMGFDVAHIVDSIIDDTIRHCARCHRGYRERDNGLRACRLHAHDRPRVFALEGRTMPFYKYDCCRAVFTREAPTGSCVGRHVTQSMKGIGKCQAGGCLCHPVKKLQN